MPKCLKQREYCFFKQDYDRDDGEVPALCKPRSHESGSECPRLVPAEGVDETPRPRKTPRPRTPARPRPRKPQMPELATFVGLVVNLLMFGLIIPALLIFTASLIRLYFLPSMVLITIKILVLKDPRGSKRILGGS